MYIQKSTAASAIIKSQGTSINATMLEPKSCDTFVVLPPYTKNNTVIFGKNSDRQQHEVQEVVFIKERSRASSVKCTYISIEESSEPLNSVILSKPAWMWGAEMGANDKNVAIGNEAVWTNVNHGHFDALEKRLLGMDLVRLGLERGNTAEHAMKIITTLLEKYGQGGPCSEADDRHYYHNSFLIADTKEAWVLETSGKVWAAEKINCGFRNISNSLTVGTKIDKHSDDMYWQAKALGLWNGESVFNFSDCFSAGEDDNRRKDGLQMLKNATSSCSFDVRDMFSILRDKKSNICRDCEDFFPTMGSQVSSLSEGISSHWFTATPDPSISYYKPFIFTPHAEISEDTKSPDGPDREHRLYKQHSKHVSADNREISKVLQRMEKEWCSEVSSFKHRYQLHQAPLSEVDQLMKKCVETEIRLYGN